MPVVNIKVGEDDVVYGWGVERGEGVDEGKGATGGEPGIN